MRKPLLTTSELAVLANKHVTTICKWAQKPGPWKAAKVGRGLFSAQSLIDSKLILREALENE